MRFISAILVFFLYVTDSTGQIDSLKQRNDTLPDKFYLLQKVKRDGVTLPEVEIKEVTVVARPGPARRNEYRKYERLICNMKKVYPYALMVRIKAEPGK